MEFVDRVRGYLERCSSAPDGLPYVHDSAAQGTPLPRYSFEIRAVRRRGERVTITPIGKTFLELPGLDAIHWLLAVEAAQSVGDEDDWRISPDLLTHLLLNPERHVWLANEPDMSEWPYSRASVRRLGEMGVLQYRGFDPEEGYLWGYKLRPTFRSLLEEIAERRPTPLSVLADALLRDESTELIRQIRPDAAQPGREGAAAATALQARMVAHELRNALIPAQMALSGFFQSAGDVAESTPTPRHRRRIEAGIARALSFVDDMLQTANLGAEPAAPFDVHAAVTEAVAALAGELNGSLRFSPPGDLPPVVGHRSRFVLAVVNVLRNAAQALSGRESTVVEVTIAAPAPHDTVTLHIDDTGPGVPPQHRRAVFAPGFALRSEGSGQGLTLVRQVIEEEMGGSVTCEESPLGGARFTIAIPVRRSVPT